VMSAAILGNFLAAAMAKVMGYRRAIAVLCMAYFSSMVATYAVPRSHTVLLVLLPIMGASGGLFALFTMYLPPLFPVLLRTTGAGFCYNIGRIAAAVGTVVFGLFTKVGDYRIALIFAGCLFLPATIIAWFLPELSDRDEESPTQVAQVGVVDR
jgi:predicted MFS family arabinose efflux permease